MNILDVTYHLSEKCTKIVTKFSGPKEFKGLKGHRVIQVNWVVYIKYSGRKTLMNICIRPQLHNSVMICVGHLGSVDSFFIQQLFSISHNCAGQGGRPWENPGVVEMESLKDVCAGVHYRIGGVVSRHNPVWRVGKNWKPKKKKKSKILRQKWTKQYNFPFKVDRL